MLLGLVAKFFRRLWRAYRADVTKVLLIFFVLVVLGSVGYKYTEGLAHPDLTWADCVWWSIVTMTTVGYGDYYPTTFYGRYAVAMPVMILGIAFLGYLLSVLATAFIESRSKELRGMSELSVASHVLLVHFQSHDRNLEIIKELKEDPKTQRKPIVLLDEGLEELPHEFRQLGVRFVRGNAAKESVLRRACVEQAAYAMVLARDVNDPSSDDHTLAAALTIEALNADVFTVAECLDPERVELMQRSGCDSVVCVARLSSCFLVQEVSDPGTLAVIGELTSNRFGQQVYVAPVEEMQSWKFAELSAFLGRQGYLVMGLRAGAAITLNPGDTHEVKRHDQAICIGRRRPAPIRITS